MRAHRESLLETVGLRFHHKSLRSQRINEQLRQLLKFESKARFASLQTFMSSVSSGCAGEIGGDFHFYLTHWVLFECASRSLHSSCDEKEWKGQNWSRPKIEFKPTENKHFSTTLDSTAEQNRQGNGFIMLPNIHLREINLNHVTPLTQRAKGSISERWRDI